MSERSERLLKITGALAQAVTSDEVFEAAVEHVAAAVDASSVGLWLASEDEATARLARSLGYGEAARQSLQTLRLDDEPSVPVLDCIRRGEPVWIDSQQQLLERYPHLRAFITPGRSYRISCIPLVARGRTLGALGITIEGEREPLDDERSFLMLVGRYASQAIERLRLFEAERRSRDEALAAAVRTEALYREIAQARARTEQLYRFARSVVEASTVEHVFEPAMDAIEATLGTSRSAILTFDDDGVMRFRAWRNLSEAYRGAVEGHTPWPRDAVAPKPVLVTDAEVDPAMVGYASMLRREGIRALAFMPLVTGGRLLGKLMVYHAEPHEYAPHEVETAWALANHLASVIKRFSLLEELRETIRYNETFAGILAHDLRNPLGAMTTAAQLLLLRQVGEGDGITKPLGRIVSSGQRMARMIEQLLDLTRVRVGGGIELHPQATDLAELCGQVMDELELVHPEWRLRREVKGNVRGVWDPDRLLQVVSNLVTNAGLHGEREAGVRVRLDGTSPSMVTLEVHNRGVIPESILPTIFDPFRGTRHRGDQAGGLGLGLYITQQLVHGHGGTIELRSTIAEGTTFLVRLPRRTAVQRSEPGAAPPP